MVRDTPPYGHAHTNYLSMNSFDGFIWPWGQRSLRYVTHRLMVMHPHTKYHWPISKDKKVMVWTSFAEKKWKKQKKRKKKSRLKQYVSLCSKGRHKLT
jgi:hypothetical protein